MAFKSPSPLTATSVFNPERLDVINSHLKSRSQVSSITPSETVMSGNPLTSHVLDTTTGRPAANMGILLYRLHGSSWELLNTKVTDNDGRAGQFLSQEAFIQGTYKMYFNTGDYFQQSGTKGFYPYVEIVFIIEKPEEHYHIPLLLSPYGYSTYRGS